MVGGLSKIFGSLFPILISDFSPRSCIGRSGPHFDCILLVGKAQGFFEFCKINLDIFSQSWSLNRIFSGDVVLAIAHSFEPIILEQALALCLVDHGSFIFGLLKIDDPNIGEHMLANFLFPKFLLSVWA